jgi:LysM repeat protein
MWDITLTVWDNEGYFETMSYWAWRPLVFALFISVWVAGCSLTAESAPTLSPTLPPQITLTVRFREPSIPTLTPQIPLTPTPQPGEPDQYVTSYTIRPADTLLGIALDFGVSIEALQAANGHIDPRNLQVGQQLIIPSQDIPPALATIIPLEIAPPACYETPTDSLVCMGRIYNTQKYTVQRVDVRVQLLRADGSILAERDTILDQNTIPPGGSAPYSARFKAEWQNYTTTATLQRVDMPPETQFVPLIIENETIQQADGRYTVAATLYNSSPYITEPPRLILTLLDDSGRVVGYRTFGATSGLDPEARQIIQIEAVSQVRSAKLTHTLYAEARRQG